MTHQEIKDNFNRHTQFEAEFIAQTFVLSVLKPDGDLVGAISEMITEGIPADKEEIETYERFLDRKSTRLNSSHVSESRMPSSA